MGEDKHRREEGVVPLVQAGLSARDVDAQVKKLCASETFEGQNRPQRLLKHLVAKSATGDVGRLNWRDIATDLQYSKTTKTSSHVRKNASALRTLLATYYAASGTGPEDIRLSIPDRQYVVYAPYSAGTRKVVGTISEPKDGATVSRRVTVRGRIETGLDLDLIPWLVVRPSNGDVYPQRPVRRNNLDYAEPITCGRAGAGVDQEEYEILLVAVDFDGFYEFYHSVRVDQDSFGRRLPPNTIVLAVTRVFRRDARG